MADLATPEALIILAVIAIGIIALSVWNRRNPMTPEEREYVEDELRIW